MSAGRTAYRYLVGIFFVGVVVQFFLAGFGVFRTQRQLDAGMRVTKHGFEDNFTAHAALGTILLGLGLLALIAAAVARLGRNRVLTVLALPLLVALQNVFAFAGPSPFRALHPVNACAILGLSGWLAHRAWRAERVAAPQAEAVTLPSG